MMPYTSFGVDLLNDSRYFPYFMGDDKYGVIDNECYSSISRRSSRRDCTNIRDKDPKNYAFEQQKQT